MSGLAQSDERTQTIARLAERVQAGEVGTQAMQAILALVRLDAREAEMLRHAARAMRRAIDVDAFAPDRASSRRAGERAAVDA